MLYCMHSIERSKTNINRKRGENARMKIEVRYED